jgi:hypothetical protein
MRTLVFGLICTVSAFASWDKGFDFRATAGYVTDPTNCTYVLGSSSGDLYPTTRNGVTFGWVVSSGNSYGDDIDSGVDARLAGVVDRGTYGDGPTFRIDLPATGTYNVSLAVGWEAGNNVPDIIAKDNTTAFITFPDTSTIPAFMDATLTARSSVADWVANNVAVSHTFTSTILNIALSTRAGALSGTAALAHLFVSTP